MSDAFDQNYFDTICMEAKPNLSAKALLATEQRIPGLGNCTLQDILFNARIHSKRNLSTLSNPEKASLFSSIKQTLAQMTNEGGRDTEKDLFGHSGGYATILSNETLETPCQNCGSVIVRQSYLGGNVYFCPNCQKEKEWD